MPLFCLKLFKHIWFEIRGTILTLTHSIIGGRPGLLITSTTTISYSLTGLLASCFVFNRLCTPHLQTHCASTLFIHVTHSIPVTEILISVSFPARGTLDFPREFETPTFIILTWIIIFYFIMYCYLIHSTSASLIEIFALCRLFLFGLHSTKNARHFVFVLNE